MDLYLLRHADANTEAVTDDARPLSEKGISQARKVGRFCKDHNLKPDLILTSPVRRAAETAEIVAEIIKGELMTEPWLACGMQPETALEELRGYERFACVMIVGHQPDFSLLAAYLLGLQDNEQIAIRKASLTHFELGAFVFGGARLCFSLPCRLM
jgi:phosphohistidine phosphatase